MKLKEFLEKSTGIYEYSIQNAYDHTSPMGKITPLNREIESIRFDIDETLGYPTAVICLTDS